MSIANCLTKLVAAKRISQKQADDALALHEGLQGRLYPTMGPTSAEAASALEAARIMAQAAKERQFKAAKQAISFAQAMDRMEKHPNGKAAGLMSMISRDNLEGGKAMGNAINLDSHSEAVSKRLLGMMDGALEPYASRMAGWSQDIESVWNMARELFDEDTGDDAAKAAAQAWKTMTQYAADRVKRAGMPLSVLEEWRLPQMWDGKRLRKFTQAQFVDDLMREFDAGNMHVMDSAGHGAAPRAAVPGIIANAYTSIITGKGGGSGGGFSNQLRTFRFNNADSFIRLQKQYGIGDGGLYNTLIGHIGGMGKRIATTEVFGPNPEANFSKLFEAANADDALRSHSSLKHRVVTRLTMNSPRAVKHAYEAATGKLDEVQSDTWAGLFGAARNLQAAARLGSAFISAVLGDSATATLAAKHVGIPVVNLVGRLVDDLTLNREGAEQIARQVNVTANALIDHAIGSKRYADDVLGQGLTGKVADTAMRVTGINTWTEGAKRTFSLELNALVARQSDHAFEKLDPSFRGFLERYGFNSADWDSMRVTPQLELDGARFFDVNAVEDQRLGDRLMSAMIDERHFAVIEPDSRVRGLTTMGLQRGTFEGEISRSLFQFKSFPVSYAMAHLTRAAMQDGFASKMGFVAQLTLLTTIAGAFSSQMGTVITGRDPMDMSKPSFWLNAWMRGGGAGMAGDFINSGVSRGGEGIGSYLAGPVLGASLGGAGDILMALGNIGEEGGGVGKGALTGKSLAQHVKAWMPGSSTWYAKLAFDRYLFDGIQKLLDSDYEETFARYERRMRDEYGQQFWFGPGDTSPRRGPSLATDAN